MWPGAVFSKSQWPFEGVYLVAALGNLCVQIQGQCTQGQSLAVPGSSLHG